MTSANAPAQASGLFLYLLAIRRRASIFASTVVVSVVIAMLALAMIHPKFTASVGILLDPKGPGLLKAEGGDFSSRPVDSIKVGSVVPVIQSNDILARVVKAQNLLDDPEFQPSRSLTARFFGAAKEEISPDVRNAIAIEKLRRGMNVFRDPFTYLIRVDYVSGNAEKAQRITQAIADAYLNDKVEARVISAPLIPIDPSSPKRSVLLSVGLGFGLLAGLGLVFLLEFLDRTVTTPMQIETSLNLPVLASVPLMEPRRSDGFWSLPESLVYVSDNPRSRYADAFRNILVCMNRGVVRRARIVQFTSPVIGDGKSTVAAGVAVSSALNGTRTILIDCDLRGFSASTLFGTADQPGMSEVMLGRKSLEEVIIPTKVSSLSIVPAGTSRRVLPDLMNMQRLRQVVMAASKRADLVIIDGGSVELTPDANMMSQIADETVLVVKWRETDRGLVTSAVQRIRRAGGHLAGVVLNAVDLREATNYGFWSESVEREIDQYYRSSGGAKVSGEAGRLPAWRHYDRAKAFLSNFGGRNAG